MAMHDASLFSRRSLDDSSSVMDTNMDSSFRPSVILRLKVCSVDMDFRSECGMISAESSPLALLYIHRPFLPNTVCKNRSSHRCRSPIFSMPYSYTFLAVLSPNPGMAEIGNGARNCISQPCGINNCPLGLALLVAILATVLLDPNPKEIGSSVSRI